MGEKKKEPEMIIEVAAEEPKAFELASDEGKAKPKAAEQDSDEDEVKPKAAEPASNEVKKDVASTLQQIKEQASEDDEAPAGTLTLRQIVGGDYLLTLVRHYVWLIVLIVILTTIYVGVRYQCQQDVIKISQMEKELMDAKYKAMASSSNLTEICRQSNVLRVLRENEDTLLRLPSQPPFVIEVKDE